MLCIVYYGEFKYLNNFLFLLNHLAVVQSCQNDQRPESKQLYVALIERRQFQHRVREHDQNDHSRQVDDFQSYRFGQFHRIFVITVELVRKMTHSKYVWHEQENRKTPDKNRHRGVSASKRIRDVHMTRTIFYGKLNNNKRMFLKNSGQPQT